MTRPSTEVPHVCTRRKRKCGRRRCVRVLTPNPTLRPRQIEPHCQKSYCSHPETGAIGVGECQVVRGGDRQWVVAGSNPAAPTMSLNRESGSCRFGDVITVVFRLIENNCWRNSHFFRNFIEREGRHVGTITKPLLQIFGRCQ
jgi:hypothetical protein